MATQFISRIHDAGKSVYFAVRDSTFNFLDFDDWTFKALADCTQPNLNSTERTGASGPGMSLYDAYLNLTLLNNTDTPIDIEILAFEKVGGSPVLSADTVIAQLFGETVKNGDVLADLPDIAEFARQLALLLGSQITVISPNVNGDVTLYANADYRSTTILLTFTCPDSVSWPDLSTGHFDRIEFHATIGSTTKKWGTPDVVVATPPGQQVTVAFTREEVNAMLALQPAATSYNLQPGTFGTALQKQLKSLNTYALYAFDSTCNQFPLSTGGLTIIGTPFDSDDSVCPTGM